MEISDVSESWVRMREATQLDGVRVLTMNFTARRETPHHVHQDYVFGLAVKGAAEIYCRRCREKHILQSGDLMLTEAREVYAGRMLGKPPWQNYSISISKEKLNSLLEFAADGNRIEMPHYVQGAIKDNHLRRLFLRLHESLGTERLPLEQESVLLNWIVLINQRYTENPENSRQNSFAETAAIRRAREFISDNFAENIKLRDVAEIARLSPFHLNRAFSAQIGLPPHTFQNQLRIEKAQKLIAQGKSFAEIAVETGFSDQSHFNRFFKRYTGVTPKKFFAR